VNVTVGRENTVEAATAARTTKAFTFVRKRWICQLLWTHKTSLTKVHRYGHKDDETDWSRVTSVTLCGVNTGKSKT